MRRVLYFGLICCSLLYYSLIGYAGEYDDLEMMGFSLVEDSHLKLHFKIRGRKDLIISKQRFANALDASTFCQAQSVPLGDIGTALFLAMSGAANGHEFIKDAIVFDFSEWSNAHYASGIWVWTGSENEDVDLMYDGHGMEVSVKSLSAINEKYHTDFKLPALCANFDKKMKFTDGH